MGGCQGSRGEATRLGGKDIRAWVKSWTAKGILDLYKDENKNDFFALRLENLGSKDNNFSLEINSRLTLTAEDINLLIDNKEAVFDYLKKIKVEKEL